MPPSIPAATNTDITIRPANEATPEDLAAVFGQRGEAARCQCQWFKILRSAWRSVPIEERRERFLEQTGCTDDRPTSTSGLVAYVAGEPAGWAAVEPRTAYPRLARARVPWTGRSEDKSDPSVWAVTCFVTRPAYRRRGVGKALTAAAVEFARERGARAVEGYPIDVHPGFNDTWGELYVGTRSMFEDAGFIEVSAPTSRRVVMRINF